VKGVLGDYRKEDDTPAKTATDKSKGEGTRGK
jgi:hypothetical protein